ncbi:MAG: tetratricopeptide repeat protein [Elusimicrobiota bacterium]
MSKNPALRKRISGVFSQGIAPLAVAVITFACFYPALHNGFVNFDDKQFLTENLDYRGFSWNHLKWMFTTLHMGNYAPLTWLSWAVDYRFWGMDPFGYHLGNILLHAANAVLFYFLALELFGKAMPITSQDERMKTQVAAVITALFFSIHPLRVESVAWAAERRDVLSGFFYLGAVLFYARGQVLPSLTAYILSLLSKGMGVSLPMILIALDIYPLRRIGPDPRTWLKAECRGVFLEKIPYLLLAAVFAAVGFFGQHSPETMRVFSEYGWLPRMAQACFGLAFYLWKTISPVNLSPLYELPVYLDPFAWRFIACGITVLILSAIFWMIRRRWMPVLLVWLGYIATLSPVLGFMQFGSQIAADRYTYLACLGWALLLGGGLLMICKRNVRERLILFLTPVVFLFLLVLGVLTWRQAHVWRDSETLWTHALSIDPKLVAAHNNLGVELAAQDRLEEAIAHFRAALLLHPGDATAGGNCAALFQRQALASAKAGKLTEAHAAYFKALVLRPYDPRIHMDLANALKAEGKYQEAAARYSIALQLDPKYAPLVYNNIGLMFAGRANHLQAIEYYRQALKAKPDYDVAYLNLGNALFMLQKYDEAIFNYRKALEINPKFAEAHNSLGWVLAQQGRLPEALQHFYMAVTYKPDYEVAKANLRIFLTRAQNKQ